jgi:cytochrome c553
MPQNRSTKAEKCCWILSQGIAQGLQDKDIRDLAAWYSRLKVTVEFPQ